MFSDANKEKSYFLRRFAPQLCIVLGSFFIPLLIHADSILAQNPDIKLIRIDRAKNSETLATQYLGDHWDDWQITELNGRALFESGDIVALPITPINPAGVYANHFQGIPILCYHQFSARSDSNNQLEVSANAFDKQMAYLVSNDYQVIPLKKLSEILAGEKAIPPKAVILTIDDGYRSVYETAYPILKKYGLTATLFVYTDFIGGSMALSWDQINEMQSSGVIGIESHTKTHSSLSYDPNAETQSSHRKRIANEIDSAEITISNHLSHRPTILAYPYGNSSSETIEHLKKSNYTLATTVKRGPNNTFADPLLLQRTMIYNNHDLSSFIKIINGKRSR